MLIRFLCVLQRFVIVILALTHNSKTDIDMELLQWSFPNHEQIAKYLTSRIFVCCLSSRRSSTTVWRHHKLTSSLHLSFYHTPHNMIRSHQWTIALWCDKLRSHSKTVITVKVEKIITAWARTITVTAELIRQKYVEQIIAQNWRYTHSKTQEGLFQALLSLVFDPTVYTLSDNDAWVKMRENCSAVAFFRLARKSIVCPSSWKYRRGVLTSGNSTLRNK